MVNTLVKTVGPGGNYATLSDAWDAAPDCVADNVIYQMALLPGIHTITSALTLSGITADATRYPEIIGIEYGQPWFKNRELWWQMLSRILLTNPNGNILVVEQPYLHIRGFMIGYTSANTLSSNGILSTPASQINGTVTIENMLFRHVAKGIEFGLNAPPLIANNCVVLDLQNIGGSIGIAGNYDTGKVALNNVNNCLVIAQDGSDISSDVYGIANSNATNCIALNIATGHNGCFYNIQTMSNCISSDTSGSSGLTGKTQSDIFSGTYPDIRLKSGGTADTAGTTVSFTSDLLGNNHGGSPRIGPLELYTADDDNIDILAAGLQPGDAIPIGRNFMSSVLSSHPAEVVGSPGSSGTAEIQLGKAWGRGCVIPTEKGFVPWGGGHASYGGIDIYAFKGDDGTLNREWKCLNDGTNRQPTGTDPVTYPDSNYPPALHSYDGLTFISTLGTAGRVLVTGSGELEGPTTTTGYDTTRNFYYIDLDTEDWVPASDETGDTISEGQLHPHLCYDATNNIAYEINTGSTCYIHKLDFSQDAGSRTTTLGTLVQDGTTPVGMSSANGSVAFLEGHNIVLLVNDTGLFFIDVSGDSVTTSEITDITSSLTGDTFPYSTLGDGTRAMFCTDDGLAYLWTGEAMYSLNISTKVITKYSASRADGLVKPYRDISTSSNGISDGFFMEGGYISSLDCFLLPLTAEEDVWLWKRPTATETIGNSLILLSEPFGSAGFLNLSGGF